MIGQKLIKQCSTTNENAKKTEVNSQTRCVDSLGNLEALFHLLFNARMCCGHYPIGQEQCSCIRSTRHQAQNSVLLVSSFANLRCLQSNCAFSIISVFAGFSICKLLSKYMHRSFFQGRRSAIVQNLLQNASCNASDVCNSWHFVCKILNTFGDLFQACIGRVQYGIRQTIPTFNLILRRSYSRKLIGRQICPQSVTGCPKGAIIAQNLGIRPLHMEVSFWKVLQELSDRHFSIFRRNRWWIRCQQFFQVPVWYRCAF